MKKLILLFLFLPILCRTQTCTTLVAYDYVETYNWIGLWFGNTLNSSYYTNASVSGTTSAVIYGTGGGSSATEQDWYVLPNITGLNSSYTYQFKLRLGSYTFTGPSSTTRGVDAADLIEVQISTNGEISYTSELRVTGNNNATWNYNNAAASKTASGAITTYSPTAGGNRTSTGDGYSVLTVTMTGITQLAVDILCRVNAGGEEWWLDNMELYEIAPCAPLPIELTSFKANLENNQIVINWETATEINNEGFVLEKSIDGFSWNELVKIEGQGTKYTPTQYKTIDSNPLKDNYYRLKQIDFNGDFKYFSPIYAYVNPKKLKTIILVIDMLGRSIIDLENYSGIYILVYDDGTIMKYYK